MRGQLIYPSLVFHPVVKVAAALKGVCFSCLHLHKELSPLSLELGKATTRIVEILYREVLLLSNSQFEIWIHVDLAIPPFCDHW